MSKQDGSYRMYLKIYILLQISKEINILTFPVKESGVKTIYMEYQIQVRFGHLKVFEFAKLYQIISFEREK